MMRIAFSGAACARQPLPNSEGFEEIDRARQQRSRPRLAGASARRGRWADRYDLGAHLRQCQRGDEARGPSTDHGNIAQGMDFRHLAIAAFDRPEKAKKSAKHGLAQLSLVGLPVGCHRVRAVPDRSHAPSVARTPQSKAFPAYPQTKKWPLVAKLDQISRVYNYKKALEFVGVGEPSRRHRLTEGTGE